jgi:hypothetical protein
MIIVIQCAASKQPGAGHLLSASGKPVDFVADPRVAPADPARVYAKPDDLSDNGISWRGVLRRITKGPPATLLASIQLISSTKTGLIGDS